MQGVSHVGKRAVVVGIGVCLAGWVSIGPAVAAPSSAVVAEYSCNTAGAVAAASGPSIWAPKYGTTSHCSLSYGKSGAGVTALQNALSMCHGQAIAADGIFGQATRAALRNVQASLGIGADGIYGPQTRSAMHFDQGAQYGCAKMSPTAG